MQPPQSRHVGYKGTRDGVPMRRPDKQHQSRETNAATSTCQEIEARLVTTINQGASLYRQ